MRYGTPNSGILLLGVINSNVYPQSGHFVVIYSIIQNFISILNQIIIIYQKQKINVKYELIIIEHLNTIFHLYYHNFKFYLQRFLHIPDEQMPKKLDATDALGIAYCHFLQLLKSNRSNQRTQKN